jgi:hypothetical protein
MHLNGRTSATATVFYLASVPAIWGLEQAYEHLQSAFLDDHKYVFGPLYLVFPLLPLFIFQPDNPSTPTKPQEPPLSSNTRPHTMASDIPSVHRAATDVIDLTKDDLNNRRRAVLEELSRPTPLSST